MPWPKIKCLRTKNAKKRKDLAREVKVKARSVTETPAAVNQMGFEFT